MTEETEAPSAQPVERRRNVDSAAAAALAGSVPDDNQYLMRMIKLLLGAPRFGLITTSLAGLIMLVYVVAKWGVPAMLAMQTLILQLHEDQTTLATADKEIQKQQVSATQDVLSAVHSISGKIDQQGAKIDEQGAKLDAQGQQIEELSNDLQSVKKAQANTDRRVGSMQAQIRARPPNE